MWTKMAMAAGMICAAMMIGGCQPQPPAHKTVINVPELPAGPPYSHAIAANGFLFVSGVVPLDPATGKVVDGDLEAQMHRVFETLKMVLAAGGATLDDVVKVSVYLQNPSDFAAMNAIYATYFPTYKPARTTVPGVEWGHGFLIEIDVIAQLRK